MHYHQGQSTLPRLVALLQSVGVSISKRQVQRLLTDKQQDFVSEAQALRVPTKPATDSEASQPPVPIEASHAFRRKPAGVVVSSEGDTISFSRRQSRQA
jgi:hypothetical protein